MPKRAGTECSPCAPIELDVLAGVDEIEPGDPHGEREPQHEDRRVEGRRAPRSSPPAAAMPSVNPRIQCESHVKRLVYE